MQPFGHRRRGALDEQRVDPLRRFERHAQAVAGGRVEQHRRTAQMQIGIEQHGVPAGLDAEMPCEIGCNRCGPNAATAAGDADRAARGDVLRRGRLFGQVGQEVAAHHVAVHRLGEILLHAQAARNLTVELDAGVAADGEDLHAGLDQFGELGQLGQRRIVVAKVDDQRLGAGHFVQRRDGVAQTAAMEVAHTAHPIGQSLAPRLFGDGVGGELYGVWRGRGVQDGNAWVDGWHD